MMTRFSLLILAVLLLSSPCAWGANVYIDPTCVNNGDGTGQECAAGAGAAGAKNTWSGLTWTAGNSYLQKAGTTFNGSVVVGASGSAGSIITLGKYGAGANPIINASGLHGLDIRNGKGYISVVDFQITGATNNQVFIYNSANNLNINGLTTTGGSYGILFSTGAFENITLSNLAISNATNTGLAVSAVSGLIISGTNTLTSNNIGLSVGGDMSDVDIAGLSVTDSTGDGILFNCATGKTFSNFTLRDSASNGNGNNGVSFTGSGTSLFNVLRVTANNNLGDGFNIHFTPVVNLTSCTANDNGVNGLGSDGDGFSYHETSSGVITKCSAHNNKKTAIAHVDAASVNHYYNKFSHDTNGTLALVYLNGTGTHVFYNNTIRSGGDAGTGISVGTGVTATIKNNIVYGFDKSLVNAGTATEDYNNFYGFATAGWEGVSQGVNSITTDPKFKSTIDFRLLPSSPCINKGTPVGLTTDFAGKSISGLPDIGAYEGSKVSGGAFRNLNINLQLGP